MISTRSNDTFGQLCGEVASCRRCQRMEGRRRVLALSNGSLKPTLMFVAEAPGRFGANRTGVPLSGDQTGRRFRSMIRLAGIDSSTIFATNAVLCNPRDGRGCNSRPTAAELKGCREYLLRTIELLDPPIVVSLGAIALRQLDSISGHGIILRRGVGCCVRWFGRYLVPLYHPGPRALVHRSAEQQLADYREVHSLMMDVLSEPRNGMVL